jgi:hypothetical protein
VWERSDRAESVEKHVAGARNPSRNSSAGVAIRPASRQSALNPSTPALRSLIMLMNEPLGCFEHGNLPNRCSAVTVARIRTVRNRLDLGRSGLATGTSFPAKTFLFTLAARGICADSCRLCAWRHPHASHDGPLSVEPVGSDLARGSRDCYHRCSRSSDKSGAAPGALATAKPKGDRPATPGGRDVKPIFIRQVAILWASRTSYLDDRCRDPTAQSVCEPL